MGMGEGDQQHRMLERLNLLVSESQDVICLLAMFCAVAHCLQVTDFGLGKIWEQEQGSMKSSSSPVNPRWLVRRGAARCCRRLQRSGSAVLGCNTACTARLLACLPACPLPDTSASCACPQAPEILNGQRATAASDVFSFGVVLWELLTWQVPWRGADFWEIVRSLVVGERLQIPERQALPGPDTQQVKRRWHCVWLQRVCLFASLPCTAANCAAARASPRAGIRLPLP